MRIYKQLRGIILEHSKYRPYGGIEFPERTWPSKQIKNAPIWCSVDLRDGNQSLEIPMTPMQKREFFGYLAKIGFKEIEIGFPSASETEYKFVRSLIEKSLIPDDVAIQVLTQSREHLIRRTFDSLDGVKRAIVHLYNATNPVHRDIVFNKSKDEIINIALEGARLFNALANEHGPEKFIFEYSPEGFSQTEPDFALEIIEAVLNEWAGREGTIINLPFTVEKATPNVHADYIEYMCKNIKNRENIVISLHAHNDRGTAVAATELGLMAGADRVEGTLFGNGERTGNADIITLALNLCSQGIDPKLDFSNIDKAKQVYEVFTGLEVHPRHPYAGDLVFTAFSGGHQDAINKGLKHMRANPGFWDVPYLPIDPADIGRSYGPIIRFNSQSGKGGAAFILEHYYGITVPKPMQRNFGPKIIAESDKRDTELTPEEVYELFMSEYVNIVSPVQLISYQETSLETSSVTAVIAHNGKEVVIKGEGSGLVDAFSSAVSEHLSISFEINGYSQHAMERGKSSRAITYVGIIAEGEHFFGAGMSSNVATSSLRAIISAVNKI